MDRFFAKIEGGFAKIYGDEFHHLRKVLRYEVGGKVGVFDGEREFIGEIVEMDEKGKVAKVRILEEVPALLPPVDVAVAFSPPKGKRLDDLLSKLAEIGVKTMVPMICERTVRRPKERKERWEKIIISAAKQAKRTDIPKILKPMNFEDVISEFSDYEGKFAGLIGSDTHITELSVKRRNVILIGPEGDFTPEEKRKIVEAGFRGFSLGEIILRVETAALISASCLLQKAWALSGSK